MSEQEIIREAAQSVVSEMLRSSRDIRGLAERCGDGSKKKTLHVFADRQEKLANAVNEVINP